MKGKLKGEFERDIVKKVQRLKPVDEHKLLKGSAPSGMPKLAKKPAKKKPVKRKTVAKKSVVQSMKPKKQLPPMRRPADLSRQAKSQPRDQNGKFKPVDQRGFFGKLWALATGEMDQHIQDCADECERGEWASFWAGEKAKKGKSK